MGAKIGLVWLLVIMLSLPIEALASDEQAAKEDPKILLSIIEDIRTGWETADGKPFRTHFLDFKGARYIETGGQNEGLDDLIHNHVEPEGDVLDGLSLGFSNIETHFEGDFAWAIADVVVEATYKADGRKIHRKGYGTFLFRYVDDAWKVVHTHSSTRPVKE